MHHNTFNISNSFNIFDITCDIGKSSKILQHVEYKLQSSGCGFCGIGYYYYIRVIIRPLIYIYE